MPGSWRAGRRSARRARRRSWPRRRGPAARRTRRRSAGRRTCAGRGRSATAARSASAARRWGSGIAALLGAGAPSLVRPEPLRSTDGRHQFHVEPPGAGQSRSVRGQPVAGPPRRDHQGGLLVVQRDQHDLVEVDAEQLEAHVLRRDARPRPRSGRARSASVTSVARPLSLASASKASGSALPLCRANRGSRRRSANFTEPGMPGQPRLAGDELHLDAADPRGPVGAQGGEELVRVRVEGGAHARGELRLLGLDVGEGGHAGMLHPAADGTGVPARPAGGRAPSARRRPPGPGACRSPSAGSGWCPRRSA